MTHLLVRSFNCSFISVLFFFLLFITKNSFAFDVSPSVIELRAAGKSTNSSLRVANDSKKPLPIEVVIYQVEVGVNGVVSKKKAGDEFLVFPPQAMIAPGASQNFKVKWVGIPDIQKSQNYIFSVNQIPVKTLATDEKKVEIVFNHTVIVNVAPTEGSSELNLAKTEIGKDKKGILRPILTISNSKNIHARLSDANIHLSSDDWSEKLSAAYLRQHLGLGLVQAGKTRRFILKIDIPETLTDLKASIDYKSR